ncbi:MAG TPA: hypothetical protein VMT17_03240 [Anaeromyxobacteraceae bacterium]|nr:hypothetical protein [Anaeromyxobacteraceae bacterium]
MRNPKKRSTLRKLNDANMQAVAGGTAPDALLHSPEEPDKSSWIDRLLFSTIVKASKAKA